MGPTRWWTGGFSTFERDNRGFRREGKDHGNRRKVQCSAGLYFVPRCELINKQTVHSYRTPPCSRDEGEEYTHQAGTDNVCAACGASTSSKWQVASCLSEEPSIAAPLS